MPTQILANGLPYSWAKPPCECKICANSFRPYDLQVPPTGCSYSLEYSDEKARQIAAEKITNINSDLAYLRHQWSSYGKTIMNRWKKKSRDKRAALLKEADPALFEKQWVAALFTNRQLEGTTQLDARKYRNAILLDYLNVDGLKSDPARLMGLVHNRTRYGPEQWALHDNQKLDWSWNGGMLEIDASNLCMIMHGPRYGELVSWEIKSAHSSEIVGFPRGKLILDAQETLYKFLRRSMKLLCEGMNQENAGETAPQSNQLDFKRSGRIDLWSTYINQPFSAPPAFNIEELHSKALARFQQMGDHLWLLQTDPAYLRQVIRTAAESFLVGHPIDEVHKWAVRDIYTDIWSYWSWSWIVEAIENVRAMQTRFRDNIHPGQPLPPEYEQVLQEFELLLESQTRNWARPLPELLAWRPGFKDYFKFDHSDPDQVSIEGIVDVPNLMRKDPLFYILHILPEDFECKKPPSYDMISRWAFLEDHLSTTTPKDAARLDAKLYDRYSDYAALHELYSLVHLHRPMPKLLEGLESLSPEEITKLGRPSIFRHQIEKILEEEYRLPHDHEASQLLLRFTKSFDVHPANEQAKLEHFDSTRKAMSNFWSIMRRKRQTLLKQKREPRWSSEEIEADLKIISSDAEPEYKVLLESERQKIIHTIERLSRPSNLPPTQTEWGATPTAKLDSKTTSKPKAKAKTRAEEPVPDVSPLALAPEQQAPQQQLSIPVKATTLRILSMMFSSTADADTDAIGKLVNWDDFVLAMQDAGFTSRQTTGSEVVFQPAESNQWGWGGRINFHKPHPVGKIDRVLLRAMGRRMGRWYGWGEGVFVVREK
ncbi:hypothetical protein LOCC1_G008893 [Lachnellula occidentalis]|uniref:Uncharacterized protein n=1 Tax=Lachnellula occidentalis TaxID=215460 RepID=A0A8H8RD84_9HELO|nr:hypothetical protein LOCC1_G008893 [Lachnellula occidentalis]